eukprot:CAMPEP_0173437212 /NCGR_PEP_ID=MMETSP1357-20121228/17905_1 /TAXON_ID=77926 /ORGANISM="Hemiselmis rufescens, Strain PCC563" /LENGTH=95 /DNA_ID=CAMNT_0014402375 /DNA_START=23 /DNA_END=307 /DNA_ORIENTATION=-
MAEQEDLDALLDSALEDFQEEAQHQDGASGGEAPAAPPAPTAEEMQRDAVGKFSALLAIFQSDIELSGPYAAEFTALADQQMDVIKRACQDGACA